MLFDFLRNIVGIVLLGIGVVLFAVCESPQALKSGVSYELQQLFKLGFALAGKPTIIVVRR